MFQMVKVFGQTLKLGFGYGHKSSLRCNTFGTPNVWPKTSDSCVKSKVRFTVSAVGGDLPPIVGGYTPLTALEYCRAGKTH